MAAAAIRAYAESQLKKIVDKTAKLDPKDASSPARAARLVSASGKWQRMIQRAA